MFAFLTFFFFFYLFGCFLQSLQFSHWRKQKSVPEGRTIRHSCKKCLPMSTTLQPHCQPIFSSAWALHSTYAPVPCSTPTVHSTSALEPLQHLWTVSSSPLLPEVANLFSALSVSPCLQCDHLRYHHQNLQSPPTFNKTVSILLMSSQLTPQMPDQCLLPPPHRGYGTAPSLGKTSFLTSPHLLNLLFILPGMCPPQLGPKTFLVTLHVQIQSATSKSFRQNLLLSLEPKTNREHKLQNINKNAFQSTWKTAASPLIFLWCY